MVSPIAYLMANTLLQLPLMFAFALFALGIPAYAIANWWGPNFGTMLLIFAVAMYAWEGFAQVFGVAFDNPLIGKIPFKT